MVSLILRSSLKQQDPKSRFRNNQDKEMSSKRVMFVRNKNS